MHLINCLQIFRFPVTIYYTYTLLLIHMVENLDQRLWHVYLVLNLINHLWGLIRQRFHTDFYGHVTPFAWLWSKMPMQLTFRTAKLMMCPACLPARIFPKKHTQCPSVEWLKPFFLLAKLSTKKLAQKCEWAWLCEPNLMNPISLP